MSSPKTTIPNGAVHKAKGARPASRQRTEQPSVPEQVLEGLCEMAEFERFGLVLGLVCHKIVRMEPTATQTPALHDTSAPLPVVTKYIGVRPGVLCGRDVERVMNYIETMQNKRYENQRLIEILDCLRHIDDKLGRLSIQPPSPGGHAGADPR